MFLHNAGAVFIIIRKSKQTNTENRKIAVQNKKRPDIKKFIVIPVLVALVVFGFALLRDFSGDGRGPDDAGSLPLSDAPEATAGAAAGTTPAAETASPAPAPTRAPEGTPDPGPSAEIPETPEPGPQGPRVPEQPPADDDFFADAAFVGNSLMDGFRMFSGLTACDYYAATSMTVTGMNSLYAVILDNGYSGTIMQALAQKEYGKIYILLGINEIGYEVSYFKSIYADMLDGIANIRPEADIYIISLTPVSAAKSASGDVFTMTRVNAYNEALLELAEEKGCFYLDLCSELSGEDGFLPPAATSDGVHLNIDYYLLWMEYMRTHYMPE